jgi:hypothetical protein
MNKQPQMICVNNDLLYLLSTSYIYIKCLYIVVNC